MSNTQDITDMLRHINILNKLLKDVTQLNSMSSYWPLLTKPMALQSGCIMECPQLHVARKCLTKPMLKRWLSRF